MLLNDRIKSFETLGFRLKNIPSEALEELFIRARNENAWFEKASVQLALDGIGLFLNHQDLQSWLSDYDLDNIQPKKIGVIAAGNIPLVGFHDLLCVLLSGHYLMIKASTKDQALMQYIVNELCDINPYYKKVITFADRLNEADAYVATGSDNTARYFEYYFKNKPNIIRKNRTSVGILTGQETEEDFIKLGKDIFQYYGLGCRNVSKLFVPKDYDFTPLLDGLQPFKSVGDHHKYRNNYDYNKSIYLVNREPHLDTEFLLVRYSEEMVSPISVLYYEEYTNEEALNARLQASESKIQCKVGLANDQIPFGDAQKPGLKDYADGVDTMKFLYQL